MHHLARAAAEASGVFDTETLDRLEIPRRRIHALRRAGVVDQVLPNVYRMVAAPESSRQRLRAALSWGGDGAAAAGRSAAEVYRLEGVIAHRPEIVVPRSRRCRTNEAVVVHRPTDARPLMIRRFDGVAVTGIEATLVSLASILGEEAFEVACEDARRRQLTSVAALHAYLDRFGGSGRSGVGATRALLRQLDPVHASRSTLEVKTRRLLVAHGITHFSRELPLEWNGRTYRFDFAFESERLILETNGRRWHDDPLDYEHDHEKWSVPGRYGYRLVFATWRNVVDRPQQFIEELTAALGRA